MAKYNRPERVARTVTAPSHSHSSHQPAAAEPSNQHAHADAS